MKYKVFTFLVLASIILGNIAYGEILSPRIANFYGANIKPGMSKEQLDILSRYSLIVGGIRTYGVEKEISYIKSKNPKILFLMYISVRGIAPDEKGMRPELWMHDPSGKLVSTWPGSYLPNQTRQEMNNLIIEKARNALAKYPQLDGIFLDSYTPDISYLNKGQLDADGSGKATDPAELNRKWAEGLIRIAKGIRAIRQNIIIMANGWGPINIAYDELNGILFEDQLGRLQDIGTGAKKGRQNFADYLLESYHKWMNVPNVPRMTTFVDGGGMINDPVEWKKIPDQTKNQLLKNASFNERKMRFNLYFSLMDDGYAAFDYGTVARGQKWWFSEWNIDLGKPLDVMKKEEGYWYRRFENGVVYVNPYHKEAQFEINNIKYGLPPFDGKFIPTKRQP
jgi:hypothetical protein